MARKLQITVAALIALMLIAAVGAYAWDSSRSDEIAKGITIGDVDVGGMTADEATDAVSSSLIRPLRDRVTVKHDGVKYRISPEKLKVRSDVDGMVERALDASQEGGLPTRVWRYATSGEVTLAITPQVTYSHEALDDFIATVSGEVDREPVDATIEPGPASLGGVAGHEGLEVNAGKLRSRLEAAVEDPADRRVNLPVEAVEPEVTRADLAARYPTYLTVDRSSFQLNLWKDMKLIKTYTVAIGAEGFDTPVGVYSIQNKAVDPAWSVPDSGWAGDLAGTVVPGGVAENPLKERWLGIYDGAGIHGTDDTGSLGSAASHGCVRMAIPDVIELYDQVPVGTPIYIG